MKPISFRFAENQFYDITRDAEVVQFQAITNLGTWHCTVECDRASEVRNKREAFREAFHTYCLTAMSLGQEPKEISLGG